MLIEPHLRTWRVCWSIGETILGKRIQYALYKLKAQILSGSIGFSKPRESSRYTYTPEICRAFSHSGGS